MRGCRRRSTNNSDCAASDRRRTRSESGRRSAAASRTIASRDWSAGKSRVRSWSADPDLGVGKESVRRQDEILRRRAFADAACGIVLRAVAGAKPAVIFALVGERDAAEMGADADHDQPLLVALLDAFAVGLGIGQARDVDALGLVNLFLGAMEDKDRLRAPEYL